MELTEGMIRKNISDIISSGKHSSYLQVFEDISKLFGEWEGDEILFLEVFFDMCKGQEFSEISFGGLNYAFDGYLSSRKVVPFVISWKMCVNSFISHYFEFEDDRTIDNLCNILLAEDIGQEDRIGIFTNVFLALRITEYKNLSWGEWFVSIFRKGWILKRLRFKLRSAFGLGLAGIN